MSGVPAARPSFRPSRPRASLSALPSSTIASSSTSAGPSNVNSNSTTTARRKRAQSLGGSALDEATKKIKLDFTAAPVELSPGKLARRKLVPRRSILKSTSNVDATATFTFEVAQGAHTTDLSSIKAPFSRRQSSMGPVKASAGADDEEDEDEDDEDDEGEMDMDITRMEELDEDGRRKSLSRRVSFAPNAHIRTFTPEKPTAQAQALLRQQQQQAAIAAAAAAAQASPSGSEEEEEEGESSFESNGSAMDMASTGNVTGAFAAHFDGPEEAEEEALEGEDDDEDRSGEGMELANEGEITRGFLSQPTAVLQSQSQSVLNPFVSASGEVVGVHGVGSQQMRRPMPRFSEIVREEDEEDEMVLKELGLLKGKGVPVLGNALEFDERDEDEQGEEMEDEEEEMEGKTTEMEMDMTTAVGGIVSSPEGSSTSNRLQSNENFGDTSLDDPEEEEDEDEDVNRLDKTMDMSMALSSAAPSPARPSPPSSQESITQNFTQSHTQTMAMEETRVYGSGILSSRAVATPAEKRVEARRLSMLKSRESLGGRRTSLGSPRRVSVAQQAAALTAMSVVVTQTVTATATTTTAIDTSNLEFPAMNSPNISPRRSHASPRKSVGSPLKPQSQSQQPSTPSRSQSPSQPRPRSRSRSRSASPTKTPSSSMTLSSGNLFVPRVPGSAGPAGQRSPGGSLSLRGLLMKEKEKEDSEKVFRPPSSLAKKSMSPGKKMRERMELDDQENVTGSDFGGASEVHPSSSRDRVLHLNQFLEEFGTNFMKDVVGLTGVDLMNKRRKSMAGRRETVSGPPTFADRAVAGGCKTLFYQLYQSDQQRLQEAIQNSIEGLSIIEEAIQNDYPKIFSDWSKADDVQRAAMIGQFRLIKAHYYLSGRIDWNVMRLQNYQAVIEVMEENLEGLRVDNAVVEASKFSDVIPGLEQRRAELIRELQEEEARDHELTTCDQAVLGELHAAIVEQSEQLLIHERHHADVVRDSAHLDERANELAEEEARLQIEKDNLVRVLEEGRCFTKAEVFRLKGEYDALQSLHGWQLSHFDAQNIKLCHLSELDVTLHLARGAVGSASLAIISASEGLKGEVTNFLFAKLVEFVDRVLGGIKAKGMQPKTILSQISSFWLSARRLRHEILLTHHRFPIKTLLHEQDDQTVLHILADVHSPRMKASFVVVFEVTGEELVEEEGGLKVEDADGVVCRVGCDVRLRWGRVDTEVLKYIVRETLDDGGRGAMVAACDQVEAKCENFS